MTTATQTMPKRRLGRTDIEVPLICLGTMMWGNQNDEAEAYAQMDASLEMGVNFWDTAEVYTVPIQAETYGRSEEFIGRYMRDRQNRDEIILASKISGPNGRFEWIRNGELGFDKGNLNRAVEASLQRLQTDYIDLYQLHWPERGGLNIFGRRYYQHPDEEAEFNFLATLQALDELVKAGKIRYVGLSNETPWGAMKFLQLAEENGLPRPVSIQNCYNLLNRNYEVGLSEVSIREDIGLLSYSSLAMGILSGKYEGGKVYPKGSRLERFPDYFDRYQSKRSLEAAEQYAQLARECGLTPTQLAYAFVNQQPFVTSNIIGATNLEQLKENIETATITLDDEVLARIEAIHDADPNPCP